MARDVTAGRTVDRLAPVRAADDVPDVVAVDQQLVRLLHRPPVRPGDETGCAQHDGREQPVVRVGDPTRLAVDVARIDQPVRLVEVNDVRDVHQARRPPRDPGARLVAADDCVDAAEPPRIERHEQRRRRHLDGFTERKPPGQLRQERAHADIADEVRVAARRVDRRRVALDVIAAPAKAEHLLDHDSLAAARVGETAVEDRDPPRPARPSAAPPADKDEAQQAQRQRGRRSHRVIEHDRAGGHRGAKAQAATQNERAGDLEVAEIAGSRRNREAQQDRRIRGHRLQRRHIDSNRLEEKREVERVDDEREGGETGQPGGQLRSPQAAGARLAGQPRCQASGKEPAGQG